MPYKDRQKQLAYMREYQRKLMRAYRDAQREHKSKLYEICVAWNKRELDSKEAMYQIWNLFEKENLRIWNQKEA